MYSTVCMYCMYIHKYGVCIIHTFTIGGDFWGSKENAFDRNPSVHLKRSLSQYLVLSLAQVFPKKTKREEKAEGDQAHHRYVRVLRRDIYMYDMYDMEALL